MADEVEDADGLAAGDEVGFELLLLPHPAAATPTADASKIQETNLRVLTQLFSSFSD
jgi:hypothetical protein